MGISLSKGSNISLSKSNPGLERLTVGLGWDVRTTDGAPFDLDASALLLKASFSNEGKVRSDADFVFYNQPADADNSVIYQGDNRTGAGDGDDEQIVIELSKVPADIESIAIVVSIDEADTRGQTFGQVRNAYVRGVNATTDEEIVKYDLAEDAGGETAVVFAEVYRDKSASGEWKFKAIGQGYASGLAGVARDFGVSV